MLQLLTLIMIVVASKSMLLMEDPKISSYPRPMSDQEKAELGPVNFGEEGFLLAAIAIINHTPGIVPPEVGRLTAYAETRTVTNLTIHYAHDELALSDCAEFF